MGHMTVLPSGSQSPNLYQHVAAARGRKGLQALSLEDPIQRPDYPPHREVHARGLISQHSGDPSAAIIWESLAPPTERHPFQRILRSVQPEPACEGLCSIPATGEQCCHSQGACSAWKRLDGRSRLCIQQAASQPLSPHPLPPSPGGGGVEGEEDSNFSVLKLKEHRCQDWG